ncbi:hypothetical protein FRC20_002412 [Serendipita sp. 405]|nr:hypothetical protein FRC20_002412 [Serendipita sp. 405]
MAHQAYALRLRNVLLAVEPIFPMHALVRLTTSSAAPSPPAEAEATADGHPNVRRETSPTIYAQVPMTSNAAYPRIPATIQATQPLRSPLLVLARNAVSTVPKRLSLLIQAKSGKSTARGTVKTTTGRPIAEWVMNHRKDINLKYVIWGQKIWNPSRDAVKPWSQWRDMEDRGSITANHWDHVHVSFDD